MSPCAGGQASKHSRRRRAFVAVQISGAPYRYWHHLHEFHDVPSGTRVIDQVTHALPLGFLGALVHRPCVRRVLERIFEYRQQRLAEIFVSL
jgi:ligand-binding SRPBCC domain-containing protein